MSICYAERLAAIGIEPSVDSVGDSCDNALAETANWLEVRIRIATPSAIACAR